MIKKLVSYMFYIIAQEMKDRSLDIVRSEHWCSNQARCVLNLL